MTQTPQNSEKSLKSLYHVPYSGVPDTARLTLYADCLVVKMAHPRLTPRKPSPRGIVSTFSRRSRKRFIDRMSQCREIGGGWVVTLSYPGLFTWKPVQVKEHLDNLRRALSRKYPEAGFFWRMELKIRLTGASKGESVPHFHLLLFGVNEKWGNLIEFFDKVWSRYAADAAEGQFSARSQVRRIKSRRHAMHYAAKYVAKEADPLADNKALNYGRHWGYEGKLSFQPSVEIETDRMVAIELKRYGVKLLKSRGCRYASRLKRSTQFAGFTVYGFGDQTFADWGTFTNSTVFRAFMNATNLH